MQQGSGLSPRQAVPGADCPKDTPGVLTSMAELGLKQKQSMGLNGSCILLDRLHGPELSESSLNVLMRSHMGGEEMIKRLHIL